MPAHGTMDSFPNQISTRRSSAMHKSQHPVGSNCSPMTKSAMYTNSIIFLALVTIVQCRPSTLGLDRSRRQVDEALELQAFEYYKKLHQEYSCSQPQMRVIPVQKIHPSNAVAYTTGSVVLHRCAEDTGCCAPTLVCVARETETVTIPVLVLKPGEDMDQPQMMPFVNHTSCHCVPENSLMAP